MTKYYPVYLDVEGKRCVVVGGGSVAERKTRALLRCEARVTVISPTLSTRLGHLSEKARLEHIAKRYEDVGLPEAFLCVAATDDPGLNRKVAEDARARGILVNVVDGPALCDFIAPSVVRRGDVTIAISTGGRSPALARRMREEIAKYLSPERVKLARLLAEVRLELKSQGKRLPPKRWQEAINDELTALLRSGKKRAARERILASLLGEGK